MKSFVAFVVASDFPEPMLLEPGLGTLQRIGVIVSRQMNPKYC
jgi:hypothetical protein